MQNVYYIDSNFIKENSFQYILSIRYATDGLSFCIHDEGNRLLAFFHQPLSAENNDILRQQMQQLISSNYLLKLEFKRVIVLSCQRHKMLMPSDYFDQNTFADFYRTCIHLAATETVTFHQMDTIKSYLLESHPCRFVNYLMEKYPGVEIINSACPFILGSLDNASFNTHYLFIDIHDQYFDLLVSRSNDILLFNSFGYAAYTDILYYALNCIQQFGIEPENLQATLSGNHVNDPSLQKLADDYLHHVTIRDYAPLAELLKNDQLNSSTFIHLLNIHKCE